MILPVLRLRKLRLEEMGDLLDAIPLERGSDGMPPQPVTWHPLILEITKATGSLLSSFVNDRGWHLMYKYLFNLLRNFLNGN